MKRGGREGRRGEERREGRRGEETREGRRGEERREEEGKRDDTTYQILYS